MSTPLPRPLRRPESDAPPSARTLGRFRRLVLDWYRENARPLPWRRTRDPWSILVSEIMLQQTRVESVQRVWPRFVARYPTPRALAVTDTRSLLGAWLGLGYNRRALALRECARRITDEHAGEVPSRPETLSELPGIGQATAASIAAFAYDVPVAFIETNIRRVFLYFFFPDRTGVHDRDILPLVESALDRAAPGRWYSALMDYGVMMKKVLPAAKAQDPNRRSAHYSRQAPFEGSDRQIRGRVLRMLTADGPLATREIRHRLDGHDPDRLGRVLDGLVRDGFARRRGARLELS